MFKNTPLLPWKCKGNVAFIILFLFIPWCTGDEIWIFHVWLAVYAHWTAYLSDHSASKVLDISIFVVYFFLFSLNDIYIFYIVPEKNKIWKLEMKKEETGEGISVREIFVRCSQFRLHWQRPEWFTCLEYTEYILEI